MESPSLYVYLAVLSVNLMIYFLTKQVAALGKDIVTELRQLQYTVETKANHIENAIEKKSQYYLHSINYKE